ncbi:MAG TPA: exodeoxyribonuclease V subunit gamma [Edaphocola sp.]|nr:exodeoxyribonuclease V subunit gamma [Edaphocola sp.]
MSLSLNISNSINELVNQIVPEINKKRPHVFVPFYIVTQTNGMNEWLKTQIAEKVGIAINIEFVKPGHIVSLSYNIIKNNEQRLVQHKGLDWLIFSILGKKDFKNRFPNQAAYFLEEGEENELKKWEFARKIDDLFDQYQIYRAKMIQEWNTVEVEALEVEQQWQAYVWRQLKAKRDFDILDHTQIKEELLLALKEPEMQARIQRQMPVLCLFGLSIITPFHLEILYELSKIIDIHWFVNNPSPENYWFEDESEKEVFLKNQKYKKNLWSANIGNELLTSWGKVLQETFRMIFNTDESFINNMIDQAIKPINANNLLGHIKNNIFNNEVAPEPLLASALKDNSVIVTSNYSIRREVETVYNYILETVIKKNDIKEKDIIVMVTDINAYAPFIRAMMDNAPHIFQYSIIDESLVQRDSLVSDLVKILKFDTHLFTAEDVLDILASSRIRNKFGISNMDFIRSAIIKANIRFGIENDFDADEDDTYLVSWKYGMQKLMFGICIDGEQKIEGLRDFFTVETSDSNAEIQELFAFNNFLDAMVHYSQQRKAKRNLVDWQSIVEEILSNFLLSDYFESEEEMTKQVLRSIQNDVLGQYLKDETISFQVYSKRLIEELDQQTVDSRIINRGITFCSLLPFRSIPFKVVAILGLNHDNFPRIEKKIDFNLMSRHPKIGDRNIKNNDRHLFLESIMSAEEALYLSYIGMDATNNKPFPPSILLDELLDYIESLVPGTNVREDLVQHHSLHSYSKRYNKHGNLLPNYLMQEAGKWLLGLPNSNIERSEKVNFSINNVASFFINSMEYFYKNELGVYFERDVEAIESNEVFELNTLEKWKMYNNLAIAEVNGVEKDAWFEKEYLNANLPLRNLATSLKSDCINELQAIFNALKENDLLGKENITQNIEYEYKGYVFSGVINDIVEDTLLHFQFKVEKENKTFESIAKLKLKYLWLMATGLMIKKAKVFTIDSILDLKVINEEEARTQLNQILDVFLEFHEEAVFYDLKAYVATIKNKDPLIEIQKEANDYNKELKHAFGIFDFNGNEKYIDKMHRIFEQILLIDQPIKNEKK